MTLKEELEILRGEPIKVFEGDPKDIPCIETSDSERLCKKPVVSVHMITYNHEPYIRQAIEGVMMQKTDFEFELVIGEDASTDKTREICFEYQKRYPDKIRVLWWHENVSRYGGNARRVTAHCRGEFIAICEGDDYWIDPFKLQKQVDVMRNYPNVGFCFCGSKLFYQSENRFEDWNEDCVTYQTGVQDKDLFFTTFMFGMGPKYRRKTSYAGFIMTATTMLRNRRRADEPRHELIDGIIVRLYYLIHVWKLQFSDCPRYHISWLAFLVTERIKTRRGIMEYARSLWKLPMRIIAVEYRWYMVPFWICSLLGIIKWPFKGIVTRIACYGQKLYSAWSKELLNKYRCVGLT